MPHKSLITTSKIRNKSPHHGVKLIKQAYKTMKLWKAGYEYTPSNLLNFEPKQLTLTKVQEEAIFRNFNYVHIGAMNAIYGVTPDENRKRPDNTKLDELFFNEIYEMNVNKYLCLYTAVLLFCLLSREPELDPKKLRYVQGFLMTNPSDSYRTPNGEKIDIMFTVHAFNTYDGAVLDTNVSQVERYRDHELDKEYVIGVDGARPEIFSHHGFFEYPGTVNHYVKLFSKKAGMTKEQWLMHHHKNAFKFSQLQ
jgi:hypothetical protein